MVPLGPADPLTCALSVLAYGTLPGDDSPDAPRICAVQKRMASDSEWGQGVVERLARVVLVGRNLERDVRVVRVVSVVLGREKVARGGTVVLADGPVVTVVGLTSGNVLGGSTVVASVGSGFVVATGTDPGVCSVSLSITPT